MRMRRILGAVLVVGATLILFDWYINGKKETLLVTPDVSRTSLKQDSNQMQNSNKLGVIAAAEVNNSETVQKSQLEISKGQENSAQRGISSVRNSIRRSYKNLDELKNDFAGSWKSIPQSAMQPEKIQSILVDHPIGPNLNKENVTEFVNSLRLIFGLPTADLALKNSNIHTQVFDFDQSVEGFQVYGGRVRVMTTEEGTKPMIINNEVKPILKLNSDISLNQNMAEDIILKKVVNPAVPISITVLDRPVAFYTNDNQGVLSWQVHVEWIKDKKMQSRDFLVSASTGAILFERDLVDY